MEVRAGYKRTEIGVIPEEWDVSFLRQHLLQDATYGVVKAGTFQRTGVPMLRSGDIKNGSIAEDQPLITIEKSQEYSRTVLRERDVVIALVGYPGDTAVIPERLVGANISRAVGLLRPAQKLRPEFLACYLNSPHGRKEFLRPSAGSAQIVVNLNALNRLRLPLPPVPEQCAIATALSDVDALLAGLDQLIAKKRDLKQSVMQQFLTGQTRLAGFLGEWETKPLSSLGAWRGGMTPSMQDPSYWEDGDFPWISSGDVKLSRLTDTSQHVTPWAVRSGVAVVVPTNSIVLVTRSGILRKYLPVALIERPMAINQDIKALIPNETVCAEFLLHALTGWGDAILANCLKSGTTVESVEFAWLKAFSIPLPPCDEQVAIAAVLSDMDAELAALEARRDKTRNLKQAMMQELLTGKTRLVPSEMADV